MVSLLALSSTCGQERIPSVTITPDNDAVDQAVDVLVNVRFSRSVSDMGPWSNFITLTEEGTADNLCTEYNVSRDITNVQCVHDDLKPDSSYLIAVSHPQAEGAISTFTTAAD